jgi:hypothetical protein
MSADALLAELQAAGVRLSLPATNGRLDLRYQTRPGVSIAPFAARIRAHKPALVRLLAHGRPVPATQPPARWDGAVCAGCPWPTLCAALGPRSPEMADGPCPAWPADTGVSDAA